MSHFGVDASFEVSIHAPTRGATRVTTVTRLHAVASFNPRPYERGDVYQEYFRNDMYEFQSTPLREGRPKLNNTQYNQSLFQSTPLREGRRRNGARFREDARVSIHAPTRGATSRSSQRRGTRYRFNPRPYERGDLHRRHWPLPSISFNPRPYERGDFSILPKVPHPLPVSIHAPTRGATAMWAWDVLMLGRFNPRPYERGDSAGCCEHRGE